MVQLGPDIKYITWGLKLLLEVQIQNDIHHASLSTGSYSIAHDAYVEDCLIWSAERDVWHFRSHLCAAVGLTESVALETEFQKSCRCCTNVPRCWHKILMLLYTFTLLRSRSAIAHTKSIHCCLSFSQCWAKRQKILTLLVAAAPMLRASESAQVHTTISCYCLLLRCLAFGRKHQIILTNFLSLLTFAIGKESHNVFLLHCHQLGHNMQVWRDTEKSHYTTMIWVFLFGVRLV